MELLKIFDDFKFSDLDEDWIKSIWDTEFLTYSEPPDEYLMFIESEDMRLLLHDSCAAVKAWLIEPENHHESACQDSERSWETFIIMDIKVRALLPVLGYIMKSGQSKEADSGLRQSCLYATSLYFVLLAIPGSNAFNVFHPNLYQRAIETLKMSEHLLPQVKKRCKSVSLETLNISEESITEVPFTPSEKAALAKNLNNIIYDFAIMTKTFWFRDHTRSLDVTVYGLLELTKVDNDGIEYCLQNRKRCVLETSLPQNAYAALQGLCDNKHGPIDLTITLIAKYILPRLLCSSTDVQIKATVNIRDGTIQFLKYILDMHEKEAKHAILSLAQHLMVKCPDRLEARQKQAATVIKLLSICRQNVLIEAFKNLVLLSHHAKIPCRIFAQEIVGKFLLEPFLAECNLIKTLKLRLKNVFFAVVLSRCMDCSNMVRGRAMAIFAEFTDLNNPVHEMILRDMFEKKNMDKDFSTFEDIRNALYEDMNPLPGSNVLIAMLTERVEDERALVRRSALQVLKNLTLMFPMLIDKVIPIVSNRCRDPTLTVRRFAVQVLSQLLQQFPDNLYLLNEWVQTVVPQIFDIEIKVQEKVLEYLQELLINRIESVSVYNKDTANNLPWKILNTLTSMKMRKHLSKACCLWVKAGIVTKSLVSNIQSHIGTENNIAAWVFLAALAENTTLPNMNNYISNYKELLENNDFHTSLVLQVLRHSWMSLDGKVLTCLHDHLHTCLQEFKINFGLVSVCLDIISTVIEYLHPSDSNKLMESNMLKLIKLSECEIKKILKNEAMAMEAAPNYLKAMFTLGHATLLCTSRISSPTLRVLEGILLEWEALPEAIKEIEELQASAVVILGQQAMRDRDIAQEVIPIFGRLMRQETNACSVTQIAVKINTAKALADICIRFTSLVEPYLSDMCVSLKDGCPQVREAIMVIFIQLLLEDFIKVKGPFFFHILTMLSDSDDMIRELTVFLIEERLLVKNKTLISQQFLESVYHYNNYRHKFHNQKMREKERKALTLPGRRNQDKRRIIYDFMLDHLDPPGKIKLLVKLTSQILSGTCTGSIDVRKEEGACVLKDTLYIINNDRLQPSSLNKQGDDAQDQEDTVVQALTPTASAINVILEGMKKHGLDVLLPTLIKLRKKLSILKSPLEYEVMKLLIKTYSEYNKEQLSSILSEYPRLEKEIERYQRQMKHHMRSNDENSEREDNTLMNVTQTKSDKDLLLTTCNLSPKVVLRRLSASYITNWTEASKYSTLKLSSPISIDSWNSCEASTPTFHLHSPLHAGPSTSTPKSSRCSTSASDYITGHVSKARKLSAFFRDAEMSDHPKRNTVKRTISQIHDDSESD